MSGYSDFSKCTICRSIFCLNNYRGKYKVTLAINAMYLIVINYHERKEEIIKDEAMRCDIEKKVVNWLNERGIIITHDLADPKSVPNPFSNEKVIINLRNGLAHLHIRVIGEPTKKIEQVKIWVTPWSKEDKKQYSTFDDGAAEIKDAMCIFAFSPKELKSFINFFANILLENIHVDPNKCDCKACNNGRLIEME